MSYSVRESKEQKFKDSMKEWENETRPFMRSRLNHERDKFDYDRKHSRSILLKMEVKKDYPKLSLEEIEVYNSRGCLTQSGDVFESVIITMEADKWEKNGINKEAMKS